MMAAAENRLLVVTLSNIGDLVMTTPVLEVLAAHYPGAPIDVVADKRSSALLEAAPYIGEIFHRDKRAGWAGQWRLLRQLRRYRYALAVDLRTPLIARLVRAERRVTKPPRRAAGEHAVAHHFRTLRTIVGDAAIPDCRVHVSDEAFAGANTLLADVTPGVIMAIAPGANWPGKRWPLARYRELLEGVGEHVDQVVVLGAADDLDEPMFDLAETGCRGVDLRGRTTLPVAAALLARSRIFVGNDSGLGHIAAAVGTPTLTLFGPGEPERYAPWGAKAQVLLAPAADLARLDERDVRDAVLAVLRSGD